MLTILAWMVFIPAVIWNIILFTIAFFDIMDTKSKYPWSNRRNQRDAIISLTLLLIPGVYLFGWF